MILVKRPGWRRVLKRPRTPRTGQGRHRPLQGRRGRRPRQAPRRPQVDLRPAGARHDPRPVRRPEGRAVPEGRSARSADGVGRRADKPLVTGRSHVVARVRRVRNLVGRCGRGRSRWRCQGRLPGHEHESHRDGKEEGRKVPRQPAQARGRMRRGRTVRAQTRIARTDRTAAMARPRRSDWFCHRHLPIPFRPTDAPFRHGKVNRFVAARRSQGS